MNKLAVLLIALALVGCVSNSERQAQQEEINRTIPSCASQKQCEATWSAARQWVTQNCGMKIQNYSNDYIETYNSPGNSAAIACQVTKNILPNSTSSININVSCSNMFRCIPDAYQSVISFNNYVNEYIKSFAPVRIGIGAIMADKNGNIVQNTSYSAGMIVKEVVLDSPAYKGGLRDGDIIISIGADNIRSEYDMITVMEKYHVGDSAKIKILRNGNTLTQTIDL